MRTESGRYGRDYLRASPNASKSTHRNFESWIEKRALAHAGRRLKRKNGGVLQCPVLYRSGAPEEIRTPDPQIRSLVLYPAELRARFHEAIGLNSPAASDKGPDGRERAL